MKNTDTYNLFTSIPLGNYNLYEIKESNIYDPTGIDITAMNAMTSAQPYKHQGKEYISTDHAKFHDHGARLADNLLGRWHTRDPLEELDFWNSPYAYCANNPVNFVDPNGKEPIKPYTGTVGGFVRFMNRLSTGIGSTTGTNAHVAMLRMGAINGIKPANTGPFNQSADRYIYTERGGWVDMAHFMFYAGRAYNYKQQKQMAQEFVKNNMGMSPETQMYWAKQARMSPVGEAIQDGYLQEFGDQFTAPHSAYSYEDLPSDKFGADFGANHFNPNSKQTFSEQIQNYLNNVLKATTPQKAPNYNNLPNQYSQGKPENQNKTTEPSFTTE